MNFGLEEREAYEKHLKGMRIETNTLKKYFQEDEQIGMAKEKQARAHKLLAKGLSLEDVCELTGLSVQSVKSLL